MIKILNSCEDTLDAKYKEAWSTINLSKEPTKVAHAYVWLGYRVLDGQVKIKDWTAHKEKLKINEIENEITRSRWQMSLLAVESYAEISIEKKSDLVSKINPQSLEHLIIGSSRENITSFVRLNCIAAYKQRLDGYSELSKAIAVAAVNKWMELIQQYDWMSDQDQLRFFEMGHQALPLHMMQSMVADKLDAEDIKRRVGEQPTYTLHWWNAIVDLEKHPNSIFL